jgi:transcriptional regulator with XRE-family HTH domain
VLTASARIRAARIYRGYTLRQAAKLYGCSHPRIAQIESGEYAVSDAVARRFAELYDVDPDYWRGAVGVRGGWGEGEYARRNRKRKRRKG